MVKSFKGDHFIMEGICKEMVVLSKRACNIVKQGENKTPANSFSGQQIRFATQD